MILLENHLKLKKIDKNGIYLENKFYFPYFVLEKVIKKHVPFTFEDDLLGKKVIAKDKSCKGIITYQTNDFIRMSGYKLIYKELLEEYIFEDRSPCGKINTFSI